MDLIYINICTCLCYKSWTSKMIQVQFLGSKRKSKGHKCIKPNYFWTRLNELKPVSGQFIPPHFIYIYIYVLLEYDLHVDLNLNVLFYSNYKMIKNGFCLERYKWFRVTRNNDFRYCDFVPMILLSSLWISFVWIMDWYEILQWPMSSDLDKNGILGSFP